MKIIHALLISLLFAAKSFADDPIKIGVIVPLSGQFASYGALVKSGIESRATPEVQFVFEDEACDGSKALEAFKKLTSIDHINLIIGPCCGSPQKVVAPALKRSNAVIIMPSAAPQSVFRESDRRMFSSQYPLELEAKFVASAMNAAGLSKAAIVYGEGDFGRTYENAFLQSFKGKIPQIIRMTAKDPTEARDVAVRLAHTDYDSIFVADATPFLFGVLTKLRQSGAVRRPVYSVYPTEMQDVITSEGNAANGVIYSYPELPPNEKALSYFPALAASIMIEFARTCNGDEKCVLEKMRKDSRFDDNGALIGNLILKTIENGQFVKK